VVATGLEHVFVGKRGEPMSKKWAEHNWCMMLEKLSIGRRPFYNCRNTVITELVRAGTISKRLPITLERV
jgi:hypothetical protein